MRARGAFHSLVLAVIGCGNSDAGSSPFRSIEPSSGGTASLGGAMASGGTVAATGNGGAGNVPTSGGTSNWAIVGGTSAAAPLIAAMTADANQYSLAHAGTRLGFANPFLYAERSDTSVISDVTQGNNNVVGGSAYAAGPGFDLATGLGSVNAQGMADALVADGASGPPQAPAA